MKEGRGRDKEEDELNSMAHNGKVKGCGRRMTKEGRKVSR